MNQVSSLLDGNCYLYKGGDASREVFVRRRCLLNREPVPVEQRTGAAVCNCMRLVQAGINPLMTMLINLNSHHVLVMNLRWLISPAS